MIPILSILADGEAIIDSWSAVEQAGFFGVVLVLFYIAWCIFWANIGRTGQRPPEAAPQPAPRPLLPAAPTVVTLPPPALPEPASAQPVLPEVSLTR